MKPRLRVERGGARRRRATGARWRRAVPTGHLRLLAAGAADPWFDVARRFLVSLESLASDDLPPGRRGAHPLVALVSYSGLVLLALAAVVAVTALGRLLERMI